MTEAAAPAPALDPASRAQGSTDPTRRPTLAVAAIIAALFFGSPAINAAIPGTAGEVEPGTPMRVGSGSSIIPGEGWTASELDGGGTRLERGVVVVDLFEVQATGGRELAQAYLDEALRPQSTELSSSPIETAADESRTAARFTYQGLFIGAEGAIEGEVTAVVATASGVGVVADAWSPSGRLDDVLEEVHEMLETLQVAS